MTHLLDDIRRAYDSRALLHEDPGLDTYRLFHGYSEGLPGLEIDRYGDTAIMTSKGADTGQFRKVADCLGELGNFRTIVGKERGKELLALRGEVPCEAQVVREAGLRYRIEAWAPLNPGLYLDARNARAWLRENSQDKHVLNLFSFAGSLGVAAMAGGAASVTHVDTQKRALKRCAANHALNSQRVDQRDLICEDVLRFLARAADGRRRFGGAIVDPPPRREGSTQTGALSPALLAAKLATLVEPGGWILCFFHHDERSWEELEAGVCAAAGRPLRVCWRGLSGSDFPEADQGRTLRLSSFEV